VIVFNVYQSSVPQSFDKGRPSNPLITHFQEIAHTFEFLDEKKKKIFSLQKNIAVE